MAVAMNDFTKLKKLVAAKEDVNVKMSDWFDSTAIQWAVHLGRLSCALYLIQHGVNPYQSASGGSAWDVAKREKIGHLLEVYEELHPVALAAFPPCSKANKLVLLGRADDRVLRFPTLRKGGGDVPLECTNSITTGGIVLEYPETRQAGPWAYTEIAVGPLEDAIKVKYDGEFLTRDDGRVFDIAHWKYEEGNFLCIVKGPNDDETHKGRGGHGGRSFTLNDDQTISPSKAPHLAFGVIGSTAPEKQWGELSRSQRARLILAEF
jgi:hypothetical protein